MATSQKLTLKENSYLNHGNNRYVCQISKANHRTDGQQFHMKMRPIDTIDKKPDLQCYKPIAKTYFKSPNQSSGDGDKVLLNSGNNNRSGIKFEKKNKLLDKEKLASCKGPKFIAKSVPNIIKSPRLTTPSDNSTAHNTLFFKIQNPPLSLLKQISNKCEHFSKYKNQLDLNRRRLNQTRAKKRESALKISIKNNQRNCILTALTLTNAMKSESPLTKEYNVQSISSKDITLKRTVNLKELAHTDVRTPGRTSPSSKRIQQLKKKRNSEIDLIRNTNPQLDIRIIKSESDDMVPYYKNSSDTDVIPTTPSSLETDKYETEGDLSDCILSQPCILSNRSMSPMKRKTEMYCKPIRVATTKVIFKNTKKLDSKEAMEKEDESKQEKEINKIHMPNSNCSSEKIRSATYNTSNPHMILPPQRRRYYTEKHEKEIVEEKDIELDRESKSVGDLQSPTPSNRTRTNYDSSILELFHKIEDSHKEQLNSLINYQKEQQRKMHENFCVQQQHLMKQLIGVILGSVYTAKPLDTSSLTTDSVSNPTD